MKINNDISNQIYELATRPDNKLTNREIGERFGIDEATVRYHVKKGESKLHQIAKTNEKAAQAIANHAVNVTEEAANILDAVKSSILEAKESGVSPEKLAPLYSNWIKSLELCGELLGKLSPPGQVNVGVDMTIQLQEYQELKAVVMGELCGMCRQRLIGRLHELSISNG